MGKEYKKELLHLEYSDRSTWKCYLSFYRNYKLNLLVTLIFFGIKYSPVWLVPIVTANIINALEKNSPDVLQYMIYQFIIGAVVILQNIPSHVAFVRSLSLVSRKVEMDLRLSLCTRLQHLSIPYHTNTKLGHIQSKVLRDVENVEMLSRMLFTAIPSVLISFSAAIIVTAMRAPEFILCYLITVPFAVICCNYFQSKVRDTNNNFRLSMELMSGRVIDMLRLITVTRAHHVEDEELKSVETRIKDVKDSGLKLDTTTSFFNSINWVIFILLNLVTIFVASVLSYKKIINIGIGDIMLLGSFFTSLSFTILQLVDLVPVIAKGFASVRSITEVLECPDIEKNEDKKVVSSLEGRIDFKGLSFSYDNTDSLAVNDFTFSVVPGDTVALVGASGSGKSTIMQLLIGFIRPTSGELLIDGNSVNDIDMRSYRRFIAVVSQESILFDGTILENIIYGAGNVSEEAIFQAIKDANLEDFIATLPEGLSTQIKEGGARLSGGQKQRLAIARALLRNPQVLLLDEATSALDVESERLIQEALDRLIEGRTTFVVAHRLSTIRNANKIIVLNHGQIAESGSHNELMALKGVYYKMVQLQTPQAVI